MDQYPIDNPIWYDLEVFPGWFEAGFRFTNGDIRQYQIDSTDSLNHFNPLLEFVAWVKDNGIPLVGFNSNSYDDLVLTAFMNSGGDPQVAYETSRSIIIDGEKPWDFPNLIQSIDLINVLPGRMSLKKIGVCLGHERLQELPAAYDQEPDHAMRSVLLGYNGNDLVITDKLYNAIYDEIKLRQTMSRLYNVDLRSKGEAALAETILLHELGSRGYDNHKRTLNKMAWEMGGAGSTVQVFRPHWWGSLVTGKLPVTEAIGEEVFITDFEIDYNGRLAKGALSNNVFIDDRFYAMGVGGLHSVDGPGAWVPKEDEILLDIDVASYYPNIVLTNQLYPRQWGEVFLDIYADIVARRLQAKRSGDKTTADVLKIAANGTYGKTSDVYSSLYDPQLTVNVTLLGQLGLLTLIEMLVGVATVCSANTDGITVLCKRSNLDRLKGVVSEWESATELEMEYTEYTGLYQRDVNSYVAVKPGNKVKAKGAFINQWPDLRHTPSANIVNTAIQQYLIEGTPVEETIRGCSDINQFILTSIVTGAWETYWNNVSQGKILRFYKSNRKDAASIIRRELGTGKETTVPDSDGCVPVPDLPEEFPKDMNFAWYVERAKSTLVTITRPKVPGMNRWARQLLMNRMSPCQVKLDGRLSRANAIASEIDFTSVAEGYAMGVKTGGNVVGVVWETGETEFYYTSKAYPGKSRDLILKQYGFTVYYGPRLPHTGIIYLLPEQDFDKFFTPAELRKVGR